MYHHHVIFGIKGLTSGTSDMWQWSGFISQWLPAMTCLYFISHHQTCVDMSCSLLSTCSCICFSSPLDRTRTILCMWWTPLLTSHVRHRWGNLRIKCPWLPWLWRNWMDMQQREAEHSVRKSLYLWLILCSVGKYLYCMVSGKCETHWYLPSSSLSRLFLPLLVLQLLDAQLHSLA